MEKGNGTTVMGMVEAAKFLGKSTPSLRNGYKKWKVPHFRLGGQIKFTRERLTEWIAEQDTQR